jgi:ketosteroid isomerase-like protein
MEERDAADGLERWMGAANRRFADAIRGRDPAAASAAYAVDARLLAPSADLIEGRDRIESFWRAGLEAGIRAVDREPQRIDGHGSLAFEIGRYAIRLRPPDGGCVVDRGAYLLVHERGGDGSWAWSLEMFTPAGTPQVASGSPAAEREEVTDRTRST